PPPGRASSRPALRAGTAQARRARHRPLPARADQRGDRACRRRLDPAQRDRLQRVRISSVETFGTPDVALVRVRTDDGAEGWGQRLGGDPRTVAAYASSMRRDITPAAEAARLARVRESHGFRAFKIRIGKECGHDEDEWPGRTESVVSEVRSAHRECRLRAA